MMSDEDVIAEIRVSDLARLNKFRAVIDEETRARLSPEGARAEAGAIEIDAQIALEQKFGK